MTHDAVTSAEGRQRAFSPASLANLRPFRAGDARTRELAARGGRATRKPKVTELLRERVEERAEKVLRPYFAGLDEQPKEEWSPSTRLEFYVNQVQLAEKLLNRVEGTPVARTRLVDAEDEEWSALAEQAPTAVLAQVIAAIVCGDFAREDER